MPIFKLGCFPVTEFWEFFVRSGYKSLIRCTICNFFYSLTCLFILFNGVFRRAIVFNFEEVQFINLFFYGLYFDVISKKSLPKIRSQRFSPVFSSISFIVLGLQICFDLFFVYLYMVEVWIEVLVCLWVDIQFFQNHLLERLSFAELSLQLHEKPIFHIWLDLFLYFFILFCWCVCLPLYQYHCLDYFSFISLKLGGDNS